jgi:antitoxin VapB
VEKQAVRIPADPGFDSKDMEVEIERPSDNKPHIMPTVQRLDGALEKFGAFSGDFMADGRGENLEEERDPPRNPDSCCAAESTS